ncbi:MAG: helix-turn-helix transcriptional regulator [Elusimicrobiota bacterium]|jgi:transcriptional regulator with XRE-family HTH domain
MGATTEKILTLARDNGLLQKDIAVATGLSESAVSRLLNGETKRDLSLPEVESILRVLRERTGRRRGLTLNDLVGSSKAA